jgi:lipoprotein-releasing system permease protein
MFELFIATRYLRAKRRQAVIGVITAISIVGVAAGVASLILALAINNGFRQDLQQRLLGSTAHVQLMRTAGDGISDWQSLQQRLSQQPHVVANASSIYEQILLSRGARAKGAVLKGVVPADERRVSDMLQQVKWGSSEALNQQPTQTQDAVPDAPTDDSDSIGAIRERVDEMPPIVLGKDMADGLGANVGSVVMATSPQGGGLTPFGFAPKFIRFKVVGIFQSGFYDYDSAWAYTRLNDAQRLFGLGDVASVMEFKIDDIYRAPRVAKEIEAAAGQGFEAGNWMEQNRELFHALRLEKIVTFITIGLIVFVAALNILISLIMMVMEKTKDIAVLMSMGARKRQIRRIFVAQGVITSLVGTAIGLVLGYILAWGLGHYHWISLSAEVYSIDYVPSAPRVIDGIVVALVAVGISFVATLYPSFTASRVLPAESLRYE